jgi:hypothetical protein
VRRTLESILIMAHEETNDSGNGSSAHINPEAGATSEAAEAAESPQAERPVSDKLDQSYFSKSLLSAQYWAILSSI